MKMNTQFGFFRGYLCTVNEDGSVPINSRVVLQPVEGSIDSDLFRQLIAQANEAPAMVEALRKMTARAELDYATYYEQELNNSEAQAYLEELEVARAILARIEGSQ